MRLDFPLPKMLHARYNSFTVGTMVISAMQNLRQSIHSLSATTRRICTMALATPQRPQDGRSTSRDLESINIQESTAITSTPSEMWYISQNIGGGWYVEGLVNTLSDHEIPDIPREIMMDLVTSACHSALDWNIPGDNGSHFDIWTEGSGKKIFSFMVYPANR